MTIFNTNNNISEDYTFILDTTEIFYDKTSIPTGIFLYDNTWHEITSSDSNFDTHYADIKDIIINTQPILLDVDQDFHTLSAEATVYVGIRTLNQSNFPDIPMSQYFAIIMTNDITACIPIKSLTFENTNIIDINAIPYSPQDFEYLSAKQTINVIKQEIEKVRLFQVVNNLNQITKPQTNLIYFVKKIPDDQADSLNMSFDLYAYNPDYTDNNDKFIKLDNITFDIRNYALKTHSHGNITSDGRIDNANSNNLVITTTNGALTTSSYLTSSKIQHDTALTNLNLSANATQFDINNKINEMINISAGCQCDYATYLNWYITSSSAGDSVRLNTLSSQILLNSNINTDLLLFYKTSNNASSDTRHFGIKVYTTDNHSSRDYDIHTLSGENIQKMNIPLNTLLCLYYHKGDEYFTLLRAFTDDNMKQGIIDGGVNLLHGAPVHSGVNPSIIASTTFHKEPIYYRDMTNRTNAYEAWWQWTIDAEDFTYEDVLTFSCYLKGDNTLIDIYFNGADGCIKSQRVAGTPASQYNTNFGDGFSRYLLTNNWKKYYITFKLDNTGDISLPKTLSIRQWGGGELYLSNAQLERGYNATDYRPSLASNNVDLSNYYTKTEIDDKIGNIEEDMLS